MGERNKEKEKRLNAQAYDDKRKKAAMTIIKHWRNAKNNKITSIANLATIIKLTQGSKTQGVIYLKDKVDCSMCKSELAIRLCEHCTEEDKKLYCQECFKSYHARGARKRHDRKRIVYEGQPFDANMSVASKKAYSDQQS